MRKKLHIDTVEALNTVNMLNCIVLVLSAPKRRNFTSKVFFFFSLMKKNNIKLFDKIKQCQFTYESGETLYIDNIEHPIDKQLY